ncbi:MAG: S-layer homology domain-containing protein [Candidatus Peregrinibacteria bacterium]
MLKSGLSRLAIGVLLTQLIFMGSISAMQATVFAAPAGEYIANLMITPSTFDPASESSEITFDLLQDAVVTVYVMDGDFNRVATMTEDEDMLAGSKSYTWYGTDTNNPTNDPLPNGDYTVFVFALEHTGGSLTVRESQTVDATLAAPIQSTYTLDVDDLTDIVTGDIRPTEIEIAYEEPGGDIGYDNVKIKLTVDSAPGDFDLTMVSPDDGTLYHLEDVGYYGPTVGFTLDALYHNILPVAAVFYAEGDYVLTFALVDMDNTENVIVSRQETFSVTEAEEVPPEPVLSTYAIDLNPADDEPVYIENEYDATIDIANIEPAGDTGYDNVKVKVTVNDTPSETPTVDLGELELMVDPYEGGTPYDLTEAGNEYWGPADGFAVTPAYTNAIPLKVTFHSGGIYEILVELVDMNNSEAVITSSTMYYRASNAELTAPIYSTYTIDVADQGDITVGTSVPDVNMTFGNEEPAGDTGYEHVKVKFTEVTAPGTYSVSAHSADDDSVYSLNEAGYWGPAADGFSMEPADYSQTVPLTFVFNTEGTYSFTFELVDLDNEEAVIASTTETYTIVPVPPVDDDGGNSGGGGGGGSPIRPRPPVNNPTTPSEGSVILQSEDVVGPFCDTDNHWAADYIDELRLMGIVQGTGECNFNPDGTFTRAEATKVSLGVFGISLMSLTVDVKPFPDVNVTHWAAPYLATGKSYMIVNGYGDGLFRPDQGITRAEALRIILESSGVSISEGSLPYSDIESYAWYGKYVSTGTELGLVEGYADGTFRPYQLVTRAEFAKMAVMMLDMI